PSTPRVLRARSDRRARSASPRSGPATNGAQAPPPPRAYLDQRCRRRRVVARQPRGALTPMWTWLAVVPAALWIAMPVAGAAPAAGSPTVQLVSSEALIGRGVDAP